MKLLKKVGLASLAIVFLLGLFVAAGEAQYRSRWQNENAAIAGGTRDAIATGNNTEGIGEAEAECRTGSISECGYGHGIGIAEDTIPPRAAFMIPGGHGRIDIIDVIIS